MKSSAKEAVAGYLFLLPNFFGFLLFTLIPVILSLILSLVNWDMLSPPKFVGLSNFISLVKDPLFWQCVGNTLFLMLIIPVEMIASLLLAFLMNQKITGARLFRFFYFLPTITNGVAICLLWVWIYNYDFGLFNSLIIKLGNFLNLTWRGIPWLTSTAWSKPSLMIMGLWVAMGGYNMILFLAALQGVPRELYEAAEIDGADGWRKFWAITWPMISPTTFFIAIMALIGGFQGGFMQAYIMTGGGPERSTTTLEYLIYNHLYSWQHVGYAAAIAWFVFVVVFLITLLNWRFGGKLVQYYHY